MSETPEPLHKPDRPVDAVVIIADTAPRARMFVISELARRSSTLSLVLLPGHFEVDEAEVLKRQAKPLFDMRELVKFASSSQYESRETDWAPLPRTRKERSSPNEPFYRKLPRHTRKW